MKRTECGGCLSPNLHPILNLGETPLADQFPATLKEANNQTRYPLVLLACEACHLVQLEEIVPDEILFGSDYGFYSGTSKAILDYYDRYADWIDIRFDQNKNLKILEIACNDGGLLKSLKNKGFHNLYGVDPASGPVKHARAEGFVVANSAFNSAWVKAAGETYDLIIANHVVAHTWNLADFFVGIHNALSDKGHAVIEFQYLPDLLVGNMIDHVYHEHRFFFSVSSFSSAAARYGLFLQGAQWIDRQGGSMRVTLSKKRPLYGNHSSPYDEGWLAHWDPYESLQGRANHVRDRLLSLIHPGRGVLAGYGAPAKATTLLNFCGLGRSEIQWVVDTTPSKIGKFMPGTTIQILEPNGDHPHQYLLFTWNYRSEIIRKEMEFIKNGGKFIIPIPYPVVI